MNFLPGRHADEALIAPQSFDASIQIQGVSSALMAGLFHGSARARAHWKPGLELTAGLCGATDDQTASPWKKDLPDGLVTLHSGAPGSVRVEPDHAIIDTLLPQSLYLLLAQQWARAGLMLVHGAAFEFEGKGILALGDKGAGKSVLTAAALAAGARVVSDDWVMVGFDQSGGLRAERLREFMMLRHGHACDRLMSKLEGARTVPLDNRPKSVLHYRDQPDALRRQCLSSCAIDRIWLLQRPSSGRFGPSIREPASPVLALAAVIRATMPLLFTRRFSHEARLLRKTSDAAFAVSELCTVRAGTDLIEDPTPVLTSLT